jgi:hypothetical protein
MAFTRRFWRTLSALQCIHPVTTSGVCVNPQPQTLNPKPRHNLRGGRTAGDMYPPPHITHTLRGGRTEGDMYPPPHMTHVSSSSYDTHSGEDGQHARLHTAHTQVSVCGADDKGRGRGGGGEGAWRPLRYRNEVPAEDLRLWQRALLMADVKGVVVPEVGLF